MVALTKHAANRILERQIPFEAVEGVRAISAILNDTPLRFIYKGMVIVAAKDGDTSRIISVWKKGEATC